MVENWMIVLPCEHHIQNTNCWEWTWAHSTSHMIAYQRILFSPRQCYLANLFLTGAILEAWKPITVIQYHCQEHNSPKHLLHGYETAKP